MNPLRYRSAARCWLSSINFGRIWHGRFVALVLVLWAGTHSGLSLTNGLAKLPPMGWNTWYCFYDSYDGAMVRGIVDAMATNGLKEAGYNYINLDGCYWVGRDTNGNMIVDQNRYPGGIEGLSDYVHSKGFKFGVYADASAWPSGCRVPAPPSYGFESNDVASFNAWKIDFLKLDFLGGPLGPGITETAESAVTRWGNLLHASPRPVMFSLSGGYIEGWKPTLANLFRISEDISVRWRGVTNNLDAANRSARLAGPGRWNDPDMLFIGAGPGMTPDENRAFFSMWCIISAPLILSTDVRTLTPENKAIFTAPELIAIDQDPLGVQGTRISSLPGNGGNLEVWCKPLSSFNTKAVALFNRSSIATNISVHWTNILLTPGPASVRDLWARTDLGWFTNNFTTNVPAHGAVVITVTGAAYGPAVFLSSLPTESSSGSVAFDRSFGNYYGFPVLSIVHHLYPQGIATVAPASVTYSLSNYTGRATTFVADLGIDMDSYGLGSATFQVWADGEKLLERGPVTAASEPETVMVDLTGRQTVQLVTLGSGRADWADARILVWTKPQLATIARGADSSVTITGADGIGEPGILDSTTSLSTDDAIWTPVATNITDSFGKLTFTVRTTNQPPKQFYRLRRN